MSGATTITSSGAPEAREEALVALDHAGDRIGLRRRVPLIALERPAEQDAVGARKHVAELALRRVAHLGLGFEDRELAADRVKLLVAEQVAAAETGAVKYQFLRQAGDGRGFAEAAHFDLAA